MAMATSCAIATQRESARTAQERQAAAVQIQTRIRDRRGQLALKQLHGAHTVLLGATRAEARAALSDAEHDLVVKFTHPRTAKKLWARAKLAVR